MKDFHCSDAGFACDFVARGNSNDEILKQAGSHAVSSHGLVPNPDLNRKVEGLIHDESSDAHKRSISSRR